MTAPALDQLRMLPGFKSSGKNQWEARCPSHEDHRASLSIGLGDDGRILLHCHAGCDLARILEAAGISQKDLFADNGNGHKAASDDRHIVAIYDYRTPDDDLSYQVVRFEPKDFRQRRPDGNGGWIPDIKGVKRLPFNLAEVNDAEYVYVVEGEKDVESLRMIGLVGTCNSGGAGKWTAGLAQYLRTNQHITIIPDNDEPGRKHAKQVAESLHGKVASVKVLELAGLPEKGDVSDWLQGRDPEAAADELSRLAEGAPEWRPTEPQQQQPATVDWRLYDAGAVDEWPQDALVWLVDGLIPRGGIGFMSAPPKDRKSLLTLDLALHTAQPKPRLWVGKFTVIPSRVLYVAREDPLRRVRERMTEICASYGMPLPEPGRLQFLIRERIHLTDCFHLEWLKNAIRQGGFELLILDVINRMHPDLDEISSKDMGLLVGILEELNRDLGVTILADDHTRKPQGRNIARDTQEPNPFDLKGSIAKYGCADFMICLSRTPQTNRMQVYCECKDSDERPHFFLDVSPKGSTEPKFTYAGSIERAAGNMKALGESNRERVFEALSADVWSSPKEIAQRISMSDSTVASHLGKLLQAGRIERRGKTRNIQYRALIAQGENIPRANSDKGLFDND